MEKDTQSKGKKKNCQRKKRIFQAPAGGKDGLGGGMS